MPRYTPADELEKVAAPLIAAYHPNLKILKIGYAFREEASISAGRVIAGMACKPSPRDNAFHKKDAIIEIAQDVWEQATTEFRNALMDHELCHVSVMMDKETNTPKMDEATMKVQVSMVPHDIEEFEAVLERHGPYHKALRSFLLKFATDKELAKAAKKAGMTSGASNATT